MQAAHASVFDTLQDAIVFGAGYAGAAAALTLRNAGRQVLLVDRDASLLWESSRAFFPETGTSDSPAWKELSDRITACGAAPAGRFDGAFAEIEATGLLIAKGVSFLYFASPMAAEIDGKLLSAVIVGTKSGLRRLSARTWVDATETAELIRLLSLNFADARPARQIMHAFLRLPTGSSIPSTSLSCSDLPNAQASLIRGIWPDEAALRIDLPGTVEQPRLALASALAAFRKVSPADAASAVVSHCSVIPFPLYAEASARLSIPANVQSAVSSLSPKPPASPAARFDLGAQAATLALSAPVTSAGEKRLNSPIKTPPVVATIETEVAVAGLGTGGPLAAVAAAREGRRVLGFDLMPFSGGIATGGGIPVYYFGVSGGLQAEMDQLVRELDPLFASREQLGHLWHSDARKIVLDRMLESAGVTALYGAILVAVETDGRRIVSALLATARGPLRLRAAAWIDATGDGDLAAEAGARFIMGRDTDGRLHAYTQSSGRVVLNEKQPRLTCINFDSGFVDPTQVEDLTRARLTGISHYAGISTDSSKRPTYIAPHLGLRQGRHIRTVDTLTMPDLIERRRFENCIGYTGCHFDSHSQDFEFESLDLMFWSWACRMWQGRTACEIPYGLIVPEDLDNVWIACRAVGVSLEAHHSFRMMRDIQRIAEPAGIAAALAVALKKTAADVPIDELQARLRKSGALTLPKEYNDTYGGVCGEGLFAQKPGFEPIADRAHGLRWIEALSDEKAIHNPYSYSKDPPAISLSLWLLYRHGSPVRNEVLALLKHSATPVSWNAAAIAAMWGESAAEGRLLQAIKNREHGYENVPENERPESMHHVVPNWMTALSLLKPCATAASIPVLAQCAQEKNLLLHVRSSIALAIEAIAQRGGLTPASRQAAQDTLDTLVATPPPDPVGSASSNVFAFSPSSAEQPYGSVREDQSWQLHVAVARGRRALGLGPHAAFALLAADPRATVRRAAASFGGMG